jgi:hypothetical protein
MKNYVAAGCYSLAALMAIAGITSATATQPGQDSITRTVESVQQMALNKTQTHIIVDPGTTHKNPISLLYGGLSVGFAIAGTLVINRSDEIAQSTNFPALLPTDGTIPTPPKPVNNGGAKRANTAPRQSNVTPNPLNRLDEYPSVLVYGPQGSGKTSTAAYLMRRRIENGHIVQVLDPHKQYGQWEGLEVFGGGMDYAEIDMKLQWFHEEVKRRYKQAEITPNYNPPKLTLVCDEFTNWATRCSSAADFFMAACTDIRKINLGVIFISHNRTLQALGDPKGMAAVRDNGIAEIELLVDSHPETGEPIPRLEAFLKMPGQPIDKRQHIKIPKIDVSFDFSEYTKAQDPRELLEKSYAIPSPDETVTAIALPPYLQSIVDFAQKRNDWITAREVKQQDFKHFKRTPTEEIRDCFQELANDYQVGELQGEGDRLQYRRV